MIVDDSFEHELSFTIINYHQLSCSLDMFKFDMIVHDSFFRLIEQMIVHDGFSVSGVTKADSMQYGYRIAIVL